jgi:hypothetical protein
MQKEQGIKVDNPFEPVSVVARLALREEMATQHKLHQNTKTPTLVKALNMCNSAGTIVRSGFTARGVDKQLGRHASMPLDARLAIFEMQTFEHLNFEYF